MRQGGLIPVVQAAEPPAQEIMRPFIRKGRERDAFKWTFRRIQPGRRPLGRGHDAEPRVHEFMHQRDGRRYASRVAGSDTVEQREKGPVAQDVETIGDV